MDGASGRKIAAFGVSSVKASDEDEAMIKELQKNAALRNPTMAAATLVGAQAQAMQDAAKNTGGAFLGFAGINMASQAGGMNAQGLYAMGGGPAKDSAADKEEWVCACGAKNTGRFCSECAKPRPEGKKGWTCPKCGTVNKGKFCMECAAPKPKGEKLYKCDKCGWEPEDPAHPPKFCPECGDPFDDGDTL